MTCDELGPRLPPARARRRGGPFPARSRGTWLGSGRGRGSADAAADTWAASPPPEGHDQGPQVSPSSHSRLR